MEVSSTILIGDTREQLRTLPAKSIHCCVTSPPYFGLRDYGMEGQLGLEQTPEAYVAAMIEVFREVHRVLRDDATCWLNIGDSYAGSWGNYGGKNRGKGGQRDITNGSVVKDQTERNGLFLPPTANVQGCKPKDLIGIPWLLAFALRADGWYLRQDIIWRKPSPMPESVTDRCTKSHEYVFLLTKSERYFYDAAAVAEKAEFVGTVTFGGPAKLARCVNGQQPSGNEKTTERRENYLTRNKRSVWTVPTRCFRGAHFACFPPDLVEPCILAGTSAYGCCSECGSPWKRITSRTKLKRKRPNDLTKRTGEEGTGNHCSNSVAGVSVETLGWEPTCACSAELAPCAVLDPFSGSGTTGAVANVLDRNYVGTELNPEYAAMWDMRLADVRKWWAKKQGKKIPKARVVSPKQAEMF